MDAIFWIVLGGAITFIAVKVIEMAGDDEKPNTGLRGGSGVSGTGPDTPGEFPKDFKK